MLRGFMIHGVVPASEQELSADPFVLRRDGDRLYSRRTSDMKGYRACVSAALPSLCEQLHGTASSARSCWKPGTT